MPCRDFYQEYPDQYYAESTIAGLKQQVSFAESALCAALNALERVHGLANLDTKQGDFYDWLDYPGSGIKKKELVKWHTRHRKLDAEHRAEAERKANEQRIRKQALAKLSTEERKILGI